MKYIVKRPQQINLVDNIKILTILKDEELNKYYPDINNWFFDKVFNNKNTIYIFLEKEKKVAGIIILKKEKEERKIRTLYIKKEYRKAGQIINIFNKIEELLKTNKPQFSFPEELKEIYLKICKKQKYKIKKQIKNKYRENKIEFFVN